MLTYKELSKTQKAKAKEKCLDRLLAGICEGALTFHDGVAGSPGGRSLQRRIDAAFRRAEKMQTPWFVHEYILDTCREDLEAIAQDDAESCLYSEPGEDVIDGVA